MIPSNYPFLASPKQHPPAGQMRVSLSLTPTELEGTGIDKLSTQKKFLHKYLELLSMERSSYLSYISLDSEVTKDELHSPLTLIFWMVLVQSSSCYSRSLYVGTKKY